MDFVKNNISAILEKTTEHLYISALGLLIGVFIAVPLGIILSNSKKLSKPVITLCSILQTIPSFALLALMIPFMGVGKKPAIIAMFIYSLLPIMRNTYLGMTGVDENVVDCAKGMGFTKKQIIFKVKLPLATAVIMSGIRLSAVYVLSWATIASYIGAGGLGDFIFNGLQNYIPEMILAGTIPVTILALFTDFILGKLEEKLSPIK
ncbi:MAG: ABC transporter permease [Tissierellia bacterium]|nr:ABC transporter permease [Tissierellia bacterium]